MHPVFCYAFCPLHPASCKSFPGFSFAPHRQPVSRCGTIRRCNILPVCGFGTNRYLMVVIVSSSVVVPNNRHWHTFYGCFFLLSEQPGAAILSTWPDSLWKKWSYTTVYAAHLTGLPF